MGKYGVVHHNPDMNEKGDIVYLLQSIANELSSIVELKKIELKYTIRFNLTEQEKMEIDEV